MPEGISENLPPKKPGIANKIIRVVKESLPWDPIGRKKRLVKPTLISDEALKKFESIRTPSKARTVVSTSAAPDREWTTLPDLEQNIRASEKFIKAIREPSLFRQDSYQPRFLKSDLGFLVEKPTEKGWFDLASVLRVANDRYELPLAIYVDRNHAQLVVKGVFQTPEGRKIMVYNPMSKGFQEINVDVTEGGEPIGITASGLVGSKIVRGEYDIVRFFEGQQLADLRSLLTNMKAFNFQNDVQNCIPYCLFVNAMIHGLEPGKTPFKEFGRKQFEDDFGIKILTREEFLPQPRVRIVR